METVEPYREAIDLIVEAGGEAFRLCFQCGLCTASCPWNMVRMFSPHKMICESRYGLVDLEDPDWWLCTTCGQCENRCPRGVGIIDIMKSIRSIMLEFQYNMAQASLRNAMGSLSGHGNPWGGNREDRHAWAQGMDIQDFHADTEFSYLPCCTPAYDDNLKAVARSTAAILQKTQTNFGIAKENEVCCGESVFKAGETALFNQLAGTNATLFENLGAQNLLVSSPHCYDVFSKNLFQARYKISVFHVTQYLWRLIEKGDLIFEKEIKKNIIYHDPCYLGRHNGIYEEPRKILESIPGITLHDEVQSRENSLCCGGGGGRIWMETLKGERFSDILVQQALDRGADILVTACPYCILNFQDSLRTLNLEGVMEIRDISEIVWEVLGD